MVLVAATLWGSSGLFVAYLSAAGLDGVQLTATRLVFAALAAGTLAGVRSVQEGRGLRCSAMDCRGALWVVVNGGIGVFAFSLLYSIAIELCGMAVAAVLIYLMPSIVTAYEVIRGRARLTVTMVVCLALSLAGCALVSGISSGFGSTSVMGVVCGLVAAVAYAVNNVIQAGPLRRYPEATVVSGSIAVAASLSVAYALAFDDLASAVAIYVVRPDALLVNALFGLACSVVTFLLYNAALRRVPASRAAVYTTFEPIAAALLGMTVLGDVPDAPTLIGIVCEVIALFLMRLVPQKSLQS